MGESFSGQEIPDSWPGHLWLEGRTIVHLKDGQERPTHMPRGPAAKSGTGFMNPAMAPARTRSILLLQDALRHGWLNGDRPIRALDALCATGIRVRRWKNEIEPNLLSRLHITANDLDVNALDWAIHSINSDVFNETSFLPDDEQNLPDFIERNGIRFQHSDARLAMVQGSFQWIDVDPFGSPISFIDGALQALGRTGVLEVTATDTAALTGSSATAGKRRYGHKGIVDFYAHDDAVRVLLGTIATRAAQLDRSIEPILALFDGHHVRVSVLVRKSKQGADKTRELMGWRVRTEGEPYAFVKHPSPEEMKQSSGPMWIGPIWNQEICSRLTEDYAVETCLAKTDDIERGKALGLEWSDADHLYAEREIRRSVRHIADAAPLLSGDHLLLAFDQIPRLANVGSLPTMERLIEALNGAGHPTARAPDLRPFIATQAPFNAVIDLVQSLQSAE